MRHDEAQQSIGAGVVYRPFAGAAGQDGEIVRCSQSMVFVLYVGDRTPKATRAEDLQLLGGPS